MPYINPNDRLKTVDWMRKAVFYQIFIDRFRQGNLTKDTSYINMKWGDLPTPKSFAGGDIRGIIEKLDYLKDLSVDLESQVRYPGLQKSRPAVWKSF